MEQKVFEVLGLSEKEYKKKYEQYLKEIQDVLTHQQFRTSAAEALLKWINKDDSLLKMIVVFDTLEKAARIVNTVLLFADLLRTTKEHRVLGELLKQLTR